MKGQGLILLFLVLGIINICPQASQAGNNAPENTALTGANPHAISLYNLGLSAYKQGSPESAIIFFKRAVDLDPDLADAQYNLGVLYQSERRLKEAVPRFEEALRVKPDDVDSHYQLALALIDLNQLTEARQHLLTIAPNSGHFSDAQKKLAFIDGQIPSQSSPSASVNPPSPDMSSHVSTEVAQTAIASSMANNTVANSFNSTNTATVIGNASVQLVSNGFAAPSGIAFDHLGNLYIANFLSSTIDRIAPDGTKSQFSTGMNLKGPIGLIADDDNNIYVANYLAGTVTKINAAGITQIIASGLKKPYYLAMDKQGNLYVSQQEDNSVIRITFGSDNTTGDTTMSGAK